MRNDIIKNVLLWLLITVILIAVINNFGPREPQTNQYTYSQFLSRVKKGEIKSVTIEQQKVTGETKDNKKFSTYLPMEDPKLLNTLIDKGVVVDAKAPEKRGFLMQIFIYWFPFLLILGIWIYILRKQMGGGKGGAFSFGRSRARLLGDGQVNVTFKDVAGCDEAKDEVTEVVDFLKEPGKFQKLGGKIPRGLLLIGPPGTGKTLLAKAVAGEAKVPFFSISGSDFVEMFVGVGASRVRDMFEQAKKQAPCIIFIDELDAVGRHRGAGLGGGHDEREQTLNQLLVEMDGFAGNEGVIVMAATNRPDVLDPALLRPGRFDRQVVVPLPDIKGREHILKVHAKTLAMSDDCDMSIIARGTPGFSGADLANLMNEAALFAARSDKKHITMRELEKAKDKILMGSERSSMVMDEEEKKLTAYHEAGHAIVGLSVTDHDPVYKVTIIPRGRALGVTMFLPDQDRYSNSKRRLESQLCSLYGGRIAEELIFGRDKVTTGAANDIKRATEIARNMVVKWGLSEKMGPLVYDDEGDEVFLGHSMQQKKFTVSEKITQDIDEEVRRIIDESYTQAEKILEEKKDILHAMAEALMTYETIESQQISDLIARKPVRVPQYWKEKEAEKELKLKKAEESEAEERQENDANSQEDDTSSKATGEEKMEESSEKNKSNKSEADSGKGSSKSDES